MARGETLVFRAMTEEDDLFFANHPAIALPRAARREVNAFKVRLNIDRILRRRFRGRAMAGRPLPRVTTLHQVPPKYPKDLQQSGSYRILWRSLEPYESLAKDLRRVKDLVPEIDQETFDWLKRCVSPGFYEVGREMYLPHSLTGDQVEAMEYLEGSARRSRGEAGEKARDLLLGFLDSQQREEYESLGRFHIVKMGPIEGYWDLPTEKRNLFAKADNPYLLRYRRYRIRRGFPNGNVQIVGHDGRPKFTLCLHPRDVYPSDDILLAQKLLIENDETRAIRDANFTLPGEDEQWMGVGVASLVE